MDPVIGAAFVAAVPASIAAWAALRTARRVKTKNGETIGELLETHTVVDQENFVALRQGQAALWEAVGRLGAHEDGDGRDHPHPG